MKKRSSPLLSSPVLSSPRPLYVSMETTATAAERNGRGKDGWIKLPLFVASQPFVVWDAGTSGGDVERLLPSLRPPPAAPAT